VIAAYSGEDLAEAAVDARGLAGDRRLALVHRETGRVVSANTPGCGAACSPSRRRGAFPGVRITAPDVGCRPALAPDVHDWLTGLLGRPVDLDTAEPNRQFSGLVRT
jgi:hypothetical protein